MHTIKITASSGNDDREEIHFTHGDNSYRYIHEKTESGNQDTIWNDTDKTRPYSAACLTADLEMYTAFRGWIRDRKKQAPILFVPSKLVSNPVVVYLSGPMTGMPELNIPAFNAEKAFCEQCGFKVLSPPDVAGKLSDSPNWSMLMKISIKSLCTADRVQTLVGWDNSPGAIVEVFVAKIIGLEVFCPDRNTPLILSGKTILSLVQKVITRRFREMGILG
jgi:hypothetical protein